jgi:uncharacterized glyoxalase superfamily protein PhnB
MPVRPIPEGFRTVTPYLVLDGADRVLQFLERAFGAKNAQCMRRPDGKIGHAQVKLGDSMIMIADATPEHPAAPCMLYLYVEDCDDWYRRAVAAGATSIMEPRTMFYGDRNAGVKDASGMQWWFGTHVEDVPPAELERRAAAQAPMPKR